MTRHPSCSPSLLRLCLHARYFIYLYMSWNHKTRKRGNWMATRIQIYPIEDQPGFHVFYRLPTLDFFKKKEKNMENSIAQLQLQMPPNPCRQVTNTICNNVRL
jgi:hypothetical protein